MGAGSFLKWECLRSEKKFEGMWNECENTHYATDIKRKKNIEA